MMKNLWLKYSFFLLLILIIGWTATAVTAQTPAHTAVEQAWQYTQQTASYQFRTHINQTSYPLPTLANVGRQPQQDQYLLEGQANQNEQELLLSFAHEADTAVTPPLQFRFKENQTYLKNNHGHWEPIEQMPDLFGTQGNPFHFLQALENVSRLDSVSQPLPAAIATHQGSDLIQYTRYRFDVNAAKFAELTRQQLEQLMRQQGDLPPGTQLQSLPLFQEMTANGEIWIGADGLPLRLIINLDFPAAPNREHVTAVLHTDFFNYEQTAVSHVTTFSNQLKTSLSSPSEQAGPHFILIALILIGIAVLIRLRHSRCLQPALSLLIALAILSEPALRVANAHRLDSTVAQQNAATSPPETHFQPPSAPEWQTHLPTAVQPATQHRLINQSVLNPLSNDGPDNDNDGLSDNLELEIGTDPLNPDSDGDSLLDGDEYLQLGTLPIADDSDSDSLLDAVEVAGFVVNGQRYYTDPLNPDTNQDGLLDGLECAPQGEILSTTGICPDTDADGQPDIIDQDNDNDQVPDASDLSPLSKIDSIFTSDNPFELSMSGLSPDNPVYVDVQLRPSNPEHLTYGLSVLDWPTGDTKGQIQRHIDSTFADTPNLDIRSNQTGAANGDMRLVPMLSIRIPKQVGHTGNLPLQDPTFRLTADTTIEEWIEALDADALKAYGIAPGVADENTLQLFVPLSLNTDSTGGGAVAFQGRMLYWPQLLDWGETHDMRFVWLVQMIVTDCQNGRCTDTLQIVHTYDEAWSVTGLNAQEQNGMDVAVIANDGTQAVDPHMWHLGYGLMHAFASGLDEDSDNQRDMTIPEIARRWQTNSTATDSERWHIPLNATAVTTHTYAHADMIMLLMMNDTPALLNSYDTSMRPTLLFAQETRYRQAGMSRVELAGRQATIYFDVASSQNTAVETDTLATLSWGNFEYIDGRWQNVNTETFINDTLIPLLQADPYFLPASDDPVAQEDARLKQRLAISQYLILLQGYSAPVQTGSVPIPSSTLTNEDLADDTLNEIRNLIEPNAAAIKTVSKATYNLGKITLSGNGLLKNKAAAALGSAIAAQLLIATISLTDVSGGDGVYVGQGVAAVVGTSIGVYTAVKLANLYRAYNHVFNIVDILSLTDKIDDLTNKVKIGKAGLLLGLAVTWGIYAFQAAQTGDWDNPKLLADAAAGTVVVLALFAIGAIAGGPAGAVAALVVLLFDSIALGVCALIGADSSDNALCGGISGALSWLIYHTNDYVNLNDANRFRIDDITISLNDPDAGMAGGNSLYYQTRLYVGLLPADDWGDDDAEIRRSTFNYYLDPWATPWRHSWPRVNSMSHLWHANGSTGRYEYRPTLGRTLHFPEAGGINATYRMYLNEAYVVLYEECWGWFIDCDDEEIRGANDINLSDSTIFDIFPATLDGFYHLQDSGDNSYRLSWGGTMDFPVQKDADGDGLRSAAFGGSDPNDGRWDSDNDGLNDKFEAEIGTDATLADSDGDGLNDYHERRLGTHPLRADSDFDGLGDAEELAGWEFVYRSGGTLHTTWVRSDPLAADADGDDLLDGKEKQYGFNPNVPSDSLVFAYDAVLDTPHNIPEGLYATAGDTLTYQAQLSNLLLSRHAYGQLETDVEAGLALPTQIEDFFLLPDESITKTHPVTVAEVPSGIYRISQSARAQIIDPRLTTFNALAYYSFDNERPLLDLSGNLPSHPLTCVGAACPGVVSNSKVGNGLQFDGTDDTFSVPELAPALGTAFSVGGWVKPTMSSSNTWSALFAFNQPDGNNDFIIFYNPQTQQFRYYDETVIDRSTAGNFPAHQWYHVMLTVTDTNQATLYINGSPELSFSTSRRPQTNSYFNIGAEFDPPGTPTDYFMGEMDELIVLNTAVSPSQIAQLMGQPQPSLDLPFDNYQALPGWSGYQFFNRAGDTLLADCTIGGENGSGVCSSSLGPVGFGVRGVALTEQARILESQLGQYNLLTASFWVEPYGIPVDLINGDLLQVSQNAANRLSITLRGGSTYNVPPALIANEWSHVVIVFDGATLIVYINGSEVGRTAYTAVLNQATGSLYVEKIDELRLYPQALAAAQIQRLYALSQEAILASFDDAPGVNRFLNEAPLAGPATCDRTTCPAIRIRERVGHVLEFSGNDQVSVPFGFDGFDEMTLMVWVKRADDGQIILQDSNGKLRLTTQQFTALYNDDALTLTLDIPADKRPSADRWTHYAVQIRRYWQVAGHDYFFHTAQAFLYVNGEQVAQLDDDQALQQLSGLGQLIVNPDGGEMMLDDLRIYHGRVPQSLINQAVQLQSYDLYLPLDEDEAATTIEEKTGQYTPTCSNCPEWGNRGQLNTAALFTGEHAIDVTQPGEFSLDNTTTTFAFWVNPEPGGGTILSQWEPTLENGAYAFYIQEDGRLVFAAQPTVETPIARVYSPQSLPQRQWTHIVGILSDASGIPRFMALYINGELVEYQANEDLLFMRTIDTYLQVGGASCGSSGCGPFNGRVDELLIYRDQLTDDNIRQLYRVQANWLNERSRYEVTVDNESPSTTLRSRPSYLPNAPTLIEVFANDPTSGIDTVNLQVSGADTATVAAPLCQDGAAETAYCPTFTPVGEGSYTLRSQATDWLGHVTTSEPVTILVDETVPTLTMDETGMPHRADASPYAAQQWLLPLNGTVIDPNLSSGDAGSGVAELLVTLYAADGRTVGQGTGAVTIENDGNWSLDYVLNFEPTGVFTAVLSTQDNVGNQTHLEQQLTLDSRAPTVQLSQPLPAVLDKDAHITGTANDDIAGQTTAGATQVEVAFVPAEIGSLLYNPPPLDNQVLHLPFASDLFHDLVGSGVQGSCLPDACPEQTAAGFREGGLVFDGDNDLLTLSGIQPELDDAFSVSLWVKPQTVPESGEQTFLTFTESSPLQLTYDSNGRFVFHGSSTIHSSDSFVNGRWHHLLLSIDSNDQASLYVNGTIQASGSETARPTHTSDLLLGGDGFDGQLDELQLFSETLAASARRQLLQGGDPLLWLPFEANWMSMGDAPIDQANWQHDLTLHTTSSTNRATAGAVGNFALQPEGSVQVAPHAALDLSHGSFTQALWLYYANTPGNNQLLIGSTNETAQAYPSLYLTPNNGLRYGFGDGSTFAGGVADGILGAGAWHFIVATFDGTTYQLYVDGQLRHSDTGLAHKTPAATQAVTVGSALAGLALDEVQLYGRVLSVHEIQMLQSSGWQPVNMSAGPGTQPWSLSVSRGLEGLFTLDVRAVDNLGNVGEKVTLWQGAIDTLAPRVEAIQHLHGQDSSWLVTDFNLEATGAGDECMFTQDRNYYHAPWYLGLSSETIGSTDRLYSVMMVCAAEDPEVCDALNNCSADTYRIFLPAVLK